MRIRVVLTMAFLAAMVSAPNVTLAQSSESYPDPQLTISASPQNVAKGLEIDAHTLGVSGYIWGYPLVRMERTMREYVNVPADKPATSFRAPPNRIGWATEVATPAAKDMPTANNDTFLHERGRDPDGALRVERAGYPMAAMRLVAL